MVDFQIAYDYLDAINEQPTSAPLRNGLQPCIARSATPSARALRTPTTTASTRSTTTAGISPDLVCACQACAPQLPSAPAIEPLLIHAAERCGEAQSRNHAVLVEGDKQLIEWARRSRTTVGTCGGSSPPAGISCLCAACAVRCRRRATTLPEAERIDTRLLPADLRDQRAARQPRRLTPTMPAVPTTASSTTTTTSRSGRGALRARSPAKPATLVERAAQPPPTRGHPRRDRQLLPLSPWGAHRARSACRDAHARLSRTIQRAHPRRDAPAAPECRLIAGAAPSRAADSLGVERLAHSGSRYLRVAGSCTSSPNATSVVM